jgi:hypothetical protein
MDLGLDTRRLPINSRPNRSRRSSSTNLESKFGMGRNESWDIVDLGGRTGLGEKGPCHDTAIALLSVGQSGSKQGRQGGPFCKNRNRIWTEGIVL